MRSGIRATDDEIIGTQKDGPRGVFRCSVVPRTYLVVGAVQEQVVAGTGDERAVGRVGLELRNQDVRIAVRVRQDAQLKRTRL